MDITMDTSLQRVKAGKNLGFLFEDDERFSSIGYKVSQAPDKDCFLKSTKLRYNGQLKIIYFVENYQNLSTMITSVPPGTISALFYKLIYVISQIPEYGYISGENLLISPEDIYFDTKTLEPKLVYLPLNADSTVETQMEFENTLRRNLYNAIKDVVHADMSALKSMLTDNSEGLDGLLKQLQKSTNIGDMKNPAGFADGMVLKCSNPNCDMSFQITKDYFTLGRAKDNDAVLNISNMISRKHCSIVKKNRKYYLKDEDSTKGTFLNGKKCQKLIEIPLQNGDIIKIWELSFVVKFI